MPEMHIVARWPDGALATYYSPSLVIAEYLEVGMTYAVADFVERSRAGLHIASERVLEKYGFRCSRAADSIARIEAKAGEFSAMPTAEVRVEAHGGADRGISLSREGTTS